MTLLDERAQLVNDTVGMPRIGWSPGMLQNVVDLAEQVGTTPTDIINRPTDTAREITAYLDDLARDP